MKEAAKPWMVKVLTDLGTRLLVVIKPHLLVKDLQGAIEHDHRAAHPGCGKVQCQLLSVLEYEDGRDVPSSVHSRYRLQDVLRRDGARVYAEFLDKEVKHAASLCDGMTPLQIGLSPHLTPLDPGSRGNLTLPREHATQHAAPRHNAVSLQASPGVGSKRGMEVVPELSGDRASKKARLNGQLEVGRQADIAAALPSHPAGHGALTTGSHRKMQLHVDRQRLPEAAARSTGRLHGDMQFDPADSPLHNDRDAQAGAGKQQQLQQQQQEKLPLSVLSKQGDAAHELPAAATEKLPTANGMQQGAISGSSSKAESSSEEDSSEEDSLPSKGPTSPSATAQHPPLAGQQQQQTGVPQPAAHGLVKPGEAQSSSGSEEESGSSSEEADVRPDPVLSKFAHLPAPTQEAQDQAPRHGAAHRPGRGEQGSSSEDDSPSSSSSPVSQQQPAPDSPVRAQQTGQQQAGPNGMVQNHDSASEVDREGSEGEGRPEASPAQDSKQAARDQAKQGALGADKSSSSSSSGSKGEGRGMPDLARRPDSQRQHELALASGGGAEGPPLGQQPDGKAPAPQQQVSNKATPTQHGPWGVAGQDEGSSSSEESESSDSEQAPHAAADLGQTNSTEKQLSAQAASHRAGKDDSAALQEQFTPVARRTRQGARAGHEAEGHAPANGGKSAAHSDGSSSESEDEITPRDDPRVVSQRDYELLQLIQSEPSINPFKVLMDARSAQRAAEREPARQTPNQAVTRGMAGVEAAGVSQHAAEQTAQRAEEDADQGANEVATLRKRASAKPLLGEAHLGRALRRATEEEQVRKQAELQKATQNPYSRPPGKMTDRIELKQLLLHNLHPIVAHEQGLPLKTAAGMFKDAQRPPWWPLELKWHKSQLDRAQEKLVQIYGAARERSQIMQKALQQQQAL